VRSSSVEFLGAFCSDWRRQPRCPIMHNVTLVRNVTVLASRNVMRDLSWIAFRKNIRSQRNMTFRSSDKSEKCN
jgi:hypothetical protein